MTKTEKTFKSTDKKTDIRYNVWQGSKKPKGIFIIVHGIAEHIDRYDELAETMVKQGYICYGADNVGHGKSGTIGKIPRRSADCLVKDIKKLYDLATKEHPRLPVVLFGHSLGSMIVKAFVGRYKVPLAGVIICGTGTIPSFTGIVKPVFLLLRGINIPYPNMIPGSALSYDKQNIENYATDPLVAHKTTVGFQVAAFLTILESCKKNWPDKLKNNTPVLIISGKKDIIGLFGKGPKITKKQLKKTGVKNVTLKLYKHGKHEILNEGKIKAKVLKDITDWTAENCN